MRRLKRMVLPVWNSGHRLAWSVAEHAGSAARGRFERCSVCGRRSLMVLRRRVVPPRLVALWGLSPRVAEALRRKESLDCVWCGAKLRARRLARAILETYPAGPWEGEAPAEPLFLDPWEGEAPAEPVSSNSVARREPRPPSSGTGPQSLREWVTSGTARNLRIAEFNIIEGIHEALTRLPSLAYSEFQEGVGPGETVHGIRCEDLTRLTYPDGSFDLALSSETLEHVPSLERALAEVFRVLRPGGWHIFTVPQIPVVLKTFARTVVNPDGSLEHRARPVCHPGGDVGYPVFTEIGADFPEILKRAGFEVDVLFGPVSDDDIAQVYVTRKPEAGP